MNIMVNVSEFRFSRMLATLFILAWGHVQPTRMDTFGPTFAERGILIDAGSMGTRLHVFHWPKRVFKSPYLPITVPEADEKWTDKAIPGIANFVDDLGQIEKQLRPLLHFAKDILRNDEAHWGYYPLYFKATGGMRQLPLDAREKILTQVKAVLNDKKINPFYFTNDSARVISGEEEATFAWLTVNLLMDTLVPNSDYSTDFPGRGLVIPEKQTFGTIDLGGASSQISFFVPNQEIMEGMSKVQIGTRRHWNIYTKSYLQYGHTSARHRHLDSITAEGKVETGAAVVPSTLDYCFHAGYREQHRNSESNVMVEVFGPPVPAADQLDRCIRVLKSNIIGNDGNWYCDQVYNGNCGIAGQYQPALPESMSFVGISSFEAPWLFFQLPPTATLSTFREKATDICRMTFGELIDYSAQLASLGKHVGTEVEDLLPYYCFLGSYTLLILEKGYGMKEKHTLTVLSSVKGDKVSWALGAILYEVNSLPWVVEEFLPWSQIYLSLMVGMLVGGVLAFFLARRSLSTQQFKRPCPVCVEREKEALLSNHWTNQILQFMPFTSTDRSEYSSIPVGSTGSKSPDSLRFDTP
jgi:hypothetical protein